MPCPESSNNFLNHFLSLTSLYLHIADAEYYCCTWSQ